MPTKAAVYLRISLDQTGEKKAVARQREDALELIKKRKWTLHDVYQDNSVSASRASKSRPQYNQLVADFKAGLFSVIVCYDLDRFTRQPRQLEDWIEASETKGLRIVTLNGEADLGTDAGRLFARVKVAVARSEIERMGARRKRANAQTVSKGRPAPGRTPFGWKKGGVKLKRKQAKVMRVAFLYLLHGGSLHKLARYWNAKGIESPQGTPWTAFKIKQLVDRKRNYGALERYGVEQPKSKIEPLVSLDTFEKVQAIVSERAQPGRVPEKHLLSGLAFCGTCGKPLGSKALRSRNSTSREPNYVCSSKINRTAEADGLRHPTIRESVLEPAVEGAVADAFLFGPKKLFPDSGAADLGDLHLRLRATADSVQRVVGLIASGAISEGEAAAQLAPLRREEDVLAQTIQEAQAASATSRFADIRGDVMQGPQISLERAAEVHQELIANFRRLDFEARRRLVKALLRIEVSTGWGLQRVKITHLVVTSLNDHDDTP
jgi:site-specific DNA recombinase